MKWQHVFDTKSPNSAPPRMQNLLISVKLFFNLGPTEQCVCCGGRRAGGMLSCSYFPSKESEEMKAFFFFMCHVEKWTCSSHGQLVPGVSPTVFLLLSSYLWGSAGQIRRLYWGWLVWKSEQILYHITQVGSEVNNNLRQSNNFERWAQILPYWCTNDSPQQWKKPH